MEPEVVPDGALVTETVSVKAEMAVAAVNTRGTDNYTGIDTRLDKFDKRMDTFDR